MNTRTFVDKHRIRMDVEQTDSNPSMDDDPKHPMDHWRCTLRMGSRRMTVVFSMGMGHRGKEPDAASVLDCLLSDSSSVDNARGFEDWCRDFGYDTDSRRAERTYKACERQAEKLRKFLGDLYEDAQRCDRL